MTARRRRALASALGALVIAVACALLSAHVDGGQRALLLVLTGAWLLIAAFCVSSALRTAAGDDPSPVSPQEEADDEPA